MEFIGRELQFKISQVDANYLYCIQVNSAG